MSDPALPSLRSLQHRAMVDPAWRAQLMADPRAALHAAGVELPAGVTVTVVDQPPGRLILPIPPIADPAGSDQPLSGDALAAVTGGATAAGYRRFNWEVVVAD